MALIREWMPSPCYTGRYGNTVRLIVLHTAEGARTIESLGNFFSNYGNQVSSHTGADDQLGRIGEYVTRGNSAWTAANYNYQAVQLELCGFAAWTRDEWMNQHHNMLRNAADWIREESGKFGIPITKLNDSQAQGNGRGVCQHINLGAGGGGHVNCGPGFPMDYVLDMAKSTTAPPATIPYGGEITMQPITGPDGKCGLAVPAHVRAIRLACSQRAKVNVQWKGSSTSTPTVELNSSRWDQNMPKDQTGLLILYIWPEPDTTGPVDFAWILE
jgi:hypothetical protein